MAKVNPFLQAIVEAPGDDATRLIYADWLDEHDQAERAEFIRVQIELARLPPEWKGSSPVYHDGLDDPRRLRLQRREQELEKAHGDRWRMEIPAWARPSSVFRRGFIASAKPTATRWLKSGAALHRAAPVEELWIRDPTGRAVEVVSSPHLARITSFAFENASPAAIQALADSPHVANLEALWLRSGPRITEASMRVLTHSPHLSHLRELGPFFNGFERAALQVLLGSPLLSQLTAISLGNNYFADEGAALLAASPEAANLTELDLWQSPNCLSVAYQIAEAGLQALAASPHLRRLTRLLLRNNRVGPAGALALATSPLLAGLTILDLGHNQLGPEGAMALASFAHTGQLATLDLDGNALGDEGAEALAASPGLATLRRLHLCGNDIGDVGGLALAHSPHLVRMAALHLENNRFTSAVRQALTERFGKAVRLSAAG